MSNENAQAAQTSERAPVAPKGNQLEGNKTQAISTKDAAALFKGSIIGDTSDADTSKAKDPKHTKQTPAKKSEKDQSEQGEAENEEISEDDEADNDQGQSEDDETDDVEENGAEDDADEAEDDAEDKDFHTVIVNGEELEVTYEELLSGYQRQADYTKKSTELAQERKALQAEKAQIADLPKVKEAYQTEAGRFAKNAQLVLVALENGFMPQPPSEELRKTNPAEYLLQKEKHQDALQFVGGVKGEMQRLEEQAKVEHQKSVNEGRIKLLQVQPELEKPEIRGKFQQYILGMGYTGEQILGEPDHRLFEFAFKAMKWDDMIERSKQKPAPEKKRPKVMKQRTAREEKSSVIQKKATEATARHKRDHSVKSASALLAQKIKNAHKIR
jgi:hypothetical protein